MKRFIKLISTVLVLSAVATASNLGGNPEVSVPMEQFNGCDPLKRLLGMCRSSQWFNINNFGTSGNIVTIGFNP